MLNGRNSIGLWQYDPARDHFEISDDISRRLCFSHNVDLQSFFLKLGGFREATFGDFTGALLSGSLNGTRHNVEGVEPPLTVELRYRIVSEKCDGQQRLEGQIYDVTQAAWMAALLDSRRSVGERLLADGGFFEWTATPSGLRRPSLEWMALTGQPLDEHATNWHERITADGRQRVIDEWRRSVETPGRVYLVNYTITKASGAEADYVSLAVRIPDERNAVVEWAGRAMPRRRDDTSPMALQSNQAAIAVSAPELRAARALLGWTLNDLAAAAHVSISSVRRMEGGETTVRPGVKISVLRAFERAGVVFLTGNGRIGVSMRS